MPRHTTGRAARYDAGLLALAGLLIVAGLVGLAADAGQWSLYCAGAGLLAAATLLWVRQATLAAHDRNLERLVGFIEAAAGSASPRPPAIDRHDLDPRLDRLARAATVLIDRLGKPSGAGGSLAAILAAMPQPVIVLTSSALVSLANKAATDFLGAGRLKIGTSVFDAVDSASLDALLASAAAGIAASGRLVLFNGDEIPARAQALAGHGGWVLVLEAGGAGGAGLSQALELHQPLPERTAPTPQTPLDQLTVMVLDCESTGLNVGFDRLLSLAAVRVQGNRLVRGETLDALFDPGEAVPAASTAVHGITDAMVMAEQPLAERWPDIEPLLRDCVVVGHNIGFDLTLLETELRRAGIRWQRPASLCTVQLIAALDPSAPNLNLEAVAQAYGIPVTGRHTALGDALVTAELYLHLLGLMAARGDRTLADAQARAATARRIIRQQEAAGW
ncbi:MAG: hypothetical protein K0S54_180 [Alphaproteobacteria bacterium]|jgi:DNA polymerase-3 subunit epsilon|nr:hypothetical protein [Alphaproteobacteria bacterium]